MRNEEILKVVEQNHDNIVRLLDSQHALTRAEIGAVNDMAKIQFEQMKAKQDYTNGCVGLNAAEIKKIKTDIALGVWVRNNWKTTIFLSVLLSWVLYSIYEVYSLVDIIKLIK